MSNYPEGHEAKSASVSTRREFIRGIGKKTIYAVPLIVTFAKADLSYAVGVPSGENNSS